MISLISKIVSDREDRMLFASMVVIAANAGGAWSPIGDVTTTMLWIDGRVSSGAIIAGLILPSLVCLAVPLTILSCMVKGEVKTAFPKDKATLLDRDFWIFLSHCAGTGGSFLIIGSAAGIAAMGLAKIDFFWYLKRISLLALAGYFSGAGCYLLFELLTKR